MKAIALKKRLKELRISQAKAADRLGVSQGMVSHWICGRHAIEAEWAIRIEKEFGVHRSQSRPDLWSAA
jgi:plasmid maintenance system antidote protein VapI